MEKARARVFIEGRVQGVFYRAFAREVAYGLSLNGWVRNLRDGRVEAVFEGDKMAIEQAIKECYTGPPGARVSRIDVQWEPYKGEEKEFSIIYRY
jgi:acylphosphatase